MISAWIWFLQSVLSVIDDTASLNNSFSFSRLFALGLVIRMTQQRAYVAALCLCKHAWLQGMTFGERATAGAKVAGKFANPDSSILVGNAFASCGSLSYIIWGVYYSCTEHRHSWQDITQQHMCTWRPIVDMAHKIWCIKILVLDQMRVYTFGWKAVKAESHM